VRGFWTLGSLDEVFDGRKIRENTLLFLCKPSDTCEDEGGGAEGGRTTELMDGAVGEGARMEGSREDVP
jgi:hypothetical protein